jgi:acetoacetyl-CoA synthetase
MMRIMKHCGISDYNEFYTWSIQNISAFWNLIWDFCGIIAQEKGLYVLENETDMEHARFFPDAKLNYAENLLRNTGQETAIVFWGEDKVKRHLTHDELRADVAAVAAGLRKSGVKAGDCVAGIVPNTPEAVIAMLATASIGAVWASCSPDFGVQGILDRFEQINPKILFTANAYYYNSKTFDCVPKLCEIVDKLPSLKKVVVFSYAKAPQGTIPKAVSWRSFTEGHEGVALKFEPLPFNHPLFIMFSSGTTGKPKCIVHGAGGTLIQHLKEHQLHSDIKPGDRVFYFTTCGWMMWNWLVSSLASGATLLLYDGSPIAPDNNILFDYADAEQMTLFGTSAKYIDALNKAGTKPMETHDLGSIRMMCSTGSPLVPQAYDYVYENIKKDICLASISGGTDILSCFALGNPIAPVWRGELQTRGLGLAVNVFDENGKPITQEKGELVCTKPFPCQPLGFWDDEDGKKYHTAYFNVFPNIWHHGDFVELTEHGGLIFYGRSDAVLNPGGIRIGTAEIYRQVEAIHEVLESICVGQDWQGDVRVILFVKLRPGMTLDENLIARIRTNIRENASPRHVPAKIIQVEGIPRTLSGKIVELAVREVIHNRPVKNIEALANPEALDYFKDLPELKTA